MDIYDEYETRAEIRGAYSLIHVTTKRGSQSIELCINGVNN